MLIKGFLPGGEGTFTVSGGGVTMPPGRVVLILIAFLGGSFFTTSAFAEDSAELIESSQTLSCHDCDIGSLDKYAIKRIFKGKTRLWENGNRIILSLIHDPSDKGYREFLQKYPGMTPRQFRNYWLKKVFSGTGAMPKFMKSKAEVKEFVQENEGSIGYAVRANRMGTTMARRMVKKVP